MSISFRKLFLNVKLKILNRAENKILNASNLQTLRQHCIKNKQKKMMLSWKLLHGIRNSSRNHCLCHPQMQVKALSCREEAICETQKPCHLLWTKTNLKWTETK